MFDRNDFRPLLPIETGDVLWCRDGWSIPMRVDVDYYDVELDLVVGKSSRNTLVSLSRLRFKRTLSACERGGQ